MNCEVVEGWDEVGSNEIHQNHMVEQERQDEFDIQTTR